jgi:hypothetical protein
MPTIKAKIGGVWTPVGGSGGGGTDEVWVSADAPTGTTQELWYDTDEPNLYDPDTARWNSAWGVVAVGTFAFSEGSTFTDGLAFTNPLSVATLTTRRYRVRFVLRAVSASVAQGFYLQLTRDGTAIDDRYNQVAPVNFNQVHGDWLLQGTGATNAYSVLFKGSIGSVGGYSGNWYIEDVGPVSLASNPPAQPASVWTNLTLLNGFTAASGNPPQYRKVGDVVELRGEVGRVGDSSNPMFNIPAGCATPVQVVHPVNVVITGVWTTTGLHIVGGGTTAQLLNVGATQISLTSVRWSVTP